MEHIEYEIVEKSYCSDDWYPHGGRFGDEQEARKKLRFMRRTYGKYGRKFRVRTRTISEWSFKNW